MHGGLDVFMEDQEESSLKIAEPTPIKAMNFFLRIRKKIRTIVSLEAAKKTALTIASSGGALAPIRGLPPGKGRERALRHQVMLLSSC